MSVLLVDAPDRCRNEMGYILDVLLTDFLGITYTVEFSPRRDVRISTGGSVAITFDASFFGKADSDWLSHATLPVLPLGWWRLDEHLAAATGVESVPVIFGRDPAADGFVDVVAGETRVGLDIFGSCFFMLSRYEEAVISGHDRHGRFPAALSTAFSQGFLHRPVVNEYVEILWILLSRLCPTLARKKRQFRVLASHDVDVPFKYLYRSTLRQLGSMIKGGVKSKSLWRELENFRNWRSVRAGDIEADPFNTFSLIMDICETAGLTTTFFFIAAHTGGKIDGDYDLDSREIRHLISEISRRGHDIGLHASYNSYLSGSQILTEFNHLRAIAAESGVQQVAWGTRQHVLRWKTPQTMQYLDDAGLEFDSTLGFADVAGFRCGTCYEYLFYNVVSRSRMRIRERALTVMECSVIDPWYMGLGATAEAASRMLALKSQCRFFSRETFLYSGIIHD